MSFEQQCILCVCVGVEVQVRYLLFISEDEPPPPQVSVPERFRSNAAAIVFPEESNIQSHVRVASGFSACHGALGSNVQWKKLRHIPQIIFII